MDCDETSAPSKWVSWRSRCISGLCWNCFWFLSGFQKQAASSFVLLLSSFLDNFKDTLHIMLRSAKFLANSFLGVRFLVQIYYSMPIKLLFLVTNCVLLFCFCLFWLATNNKVPRLSAMFRQSTGSAVKLHERLSPLSVLPNKKNKSLWNGSGRRTRLQEISETYLWQAN